MRAVRIHVEGVVQGVGFRPWVWRVARGLGLRGWVRNNSSGVEILAEGSGEGIQRLLGALGAEAPDLARIDAVRVEACAPEGLIGFGIAGSESEEGAYLPISPDVATCEACLAEMRDPNDRRFRYPFINCTSCGPRFTIVRDIPYDRARTTMAQFRMCERCRAEYEDPSDRRFHAQPIACPACGPRLCLVKGDEAAAWDDGALREARRVLREGGIVAVKGLGGFHLACDASNPKVVARLREGKRREGKPFALMAPDVPGVERVATVSQAQRRLLRSPARPVVLLERRGGSAIAAGVAPGLDRLGLMLPYTPLHHLLMEPEAGYPQVLVMTSANLSDEPIAYEDSNARARLSSIADAFLLHDRPIHMRTDDSVAAERAGRAYLFRRSRGYAPLPVGLPLSGRSVLGVGGEMKSVFCLTRDDRAFLSHHIGELGHLEAFQSFLEGLEHFQRLFRIRPEMVAHDLHPDYLATRAALERAARDGIPAIGVQHHHAHIASCMADNGVEDGRRVIGVCFDGTGYGTDGAIWGGEFLVCGYAEFERVSHLRYVALPGGDAATTRPYRTALSWLREAGVAWSDDLAPVREAGGQERVVLERQIETGINSPRTSSVGRLFDAFSSLAGVCHRITYEAQAAAELEALARGAGDARGEYPFGAGAGEVDPRPALREAVEDVRRAVGAGVIARRFHRGLARMVSRECRRIREAYGIDGVALSGGVWQNMLLLDEAVSMLEEVGLTVLVHHQVPANDAGLALGQVAVALARAGADQV